MCPSILPRRGRVTGDRRQASPLFHLMFRAFEPSKFQHQIVFLSVNKFQNEWMIPAHGGVKTASGPLNSSMVAPPPKTGCNLKTTGTLSSQEEVSTGIRQSLSQTKPKPTFSKGFSRTLVRKDQY